MTPKNENEELVWGYPRLFLTRLEQGGSSRISTADRGWRYHSGEFYTTVDGLSTTLLLLFLLLIPQNLGIIASLFSFGTQTIER